jgi:hypothetical protein
MVADLFEVMQHIDKDKPEVKGTFTGKSYFLIEKGNFARGSPEVFVSEKTWISA